VNILFIHQNFPGQFIHLAANFAQVQKNKVVALTIDQHPVPPGVIVRPYTLLREPVERTHFLLRDQEAKILRAEACAAAALQLKREGFTPDIIVAHPGWGEALFIKDVFPTSKLVIYCEYYYAAEGQDVGFDPEQLALTFPQRCQLRLKNTTNLLSMEIADAAISPTEWQKSTYPLWAQHKITVIHDGIDLDRLKFNPAIQFKTKTPDEIKPITFTPGNEVFSYVARNLEPVRGFHVFMRTLPEILRRRPKAHVVVVGGNCVSYGQLPADGRSWKEHMLNEVEGQLDLNRVHFVGQVTYEDYLHLLSVSKIHTYWTTPFVLSWSFLEAAASGLPVIASSTPPVLEFATELKVQTADFFDNQAYADTIIEQLEKPHQRHKLIASERIDLQHCLRRQLAFLNSL
jgi:glycosyltransferase involved in cell wall biosynthesis